MQDLRARMEVSEGRLAGSTSLTTSTDIPVLTIVALALAAVSYFVLCLQHTASLSTLSIYPSHLKLPGTLLHCHVLELLVLHLPISPLSSLHMVYGFMVVCKSFNQLRVVLTYQLRWLCLSC